MKNWTCSEFSITLDADETPELLDRVSSTIRTIPTFQLLNIVVNVCDGEATASVYFYREDEEEEQ